MSLFTLMSDEAYCLICVFISFVQHEKNKQMKHKHSSLKEFVRGEMPWQIEKNVLQLHGNWGGVPRKSIRAPSAVYCHTLVTHTHLVMDDHHITVVCTQPSVHGLTDAADFVKGGSVVVGPAKVQHLSDNRGRKSERNSGRIKSESQSCDLPLDWVEWCHNAFHWGWRAKRE